jgi:glucose-1-phosphate thymidylyltransferase
MIAIILAGGFAKRMWPLTKNTPKHLLPINNKPMLEYTLNKLVDIDGLETVYITTNQKFEDNFNIFIENFTSKLEDINFDLKLIIEDALSEGEKLGSIGALGKLINEEQLNNKDCLVIGGDNLFGFEFKNFLKFYYQRKSSVIALFDIGSLEKAELYGVVEVDHLLKIVNFKEKPDNPSSSLVSTACYLFNPETLTNIITYLDEGNNPDAMGFLIDWLYPRVDIYGYVFKEPWFDIGSTDIYHQANEYYSKLL